MGLHQAKSFLPRKQNHQQNEETTYGMKEIFANYIPEKSFISRIYKELNLLKANNLNRKCVILKCIFLKGFCTNGQYIHEKCSK